MDAYTALFNCHKNGGLEKTISKFKEIWGENRFEAKIKPFIDNGIMSMFSKKPCNSTRFFVFYNQSIVNGERL